MGGNESHNDHKNPCREKKQQRGGTMNVSSASPNRRHTSPLNILALVFANCSSLIAFFSTQKAVVTAPRAHTEARGSSNIIVQIGTADRKVPETAINSFSEYILIWCSVCEARQGNLFHDSQFGCAASARDKLQSNPLLGCREIGVESFAFWGLGQAASWRDE